MIKEKLPVPIHLGVTPVPIPNTMVKTQAADGTMLETIWESRWLPDLNGGVAQLGEHLPCKQGVMSSNLTVSTRFHNGVEIAKQFASSREARGCTLKTSYSRDN